MEKIFEEINSQLKESVENQVSAKGIDEDSFAQVEKGGGSIPFEMRLDGNGNGHYETTQKGWGITISATATIQEPSDALFNVVVRSSDGGGDEWYNVSAGESLRCKLKTSFWHATKITVDVHCSKPGVVMKANLSYSY